MTVKNITQYTDADLAEFKALIDKELSKSEKQLSSLETQLAEAIENKDNEGEFMDNSSDSNDVEMAQVLVDRQEVNIVELKNALLRIANKSYGVCVVTGQLIDKRRLLAVPTTTKSLAVNGKKST